MKDSYFQEGDLILHRIFNREGIILSVKDRCVGSPGSYYYERWYKVLWDRDTPISYPEFTCPSESWVPEKEIGFGSRTRICWMILLERS